LLGAARTRSPDSGQECSESIQQVSHPRGAGPLKQDHPGSRKGPTSNSIITQKKNHPIFSADSESRSPISRNMIFHAGP